MCASIRTSRYRQAALKCAADGGGCKGVESILWSEVGTRQYYEAEVGQKPLGEFVGRS